MRGMEIRVARRHEFAVVLDWAAAEGWNPGLGDLAAFFATDGCGFLIGFMDGQPMASISVVRYGQDFGFLGFYIVAPDFRGAGAGLAIWKAGMARLDNRTVGLDGVLDAQENYRQSGFELAGRNIRFGGVPVGVEQGDSSCTILNFSPEFFATVQTFDRSVFGAPREGFLRAWTNNIPEGGRKTKIAVKDGDLAGYGTVRPCRSGYKIGPLFARTPQIAQGLLAGICGGLPKDREVFLDVPEDNGAGMALAEQFGLAPVFETARMYRGRAPDLPVNTIFGITSFELG
jgi:GNAT acetyltransferase-like protein/acetyltransferase (GNAT) family protein